MTELSRLLRGSGIYGLIGVGTSVLGVVAVPIYAHAMGPADYGVVSLVTATINLLAVFVVLGLDSASARWYGDEDVADDDRRTTFASWLICQAVVSAVLAGVLAGLSAPIASSLIGGHASTNALRWAALSLPLSAPAVIALNWARLRQRPWLAVGLGLGGPTASTATSLLLVVGAGWGPSGVFAGQCVGAAVIGLVAIGAMRGWIGWRHVQSGRLVAMLRYSLWLVPAAIASWTLNLLDRYVIRAIDGTHLVGVYQVAYTVAALTALVTSGFQLAWGPFAFSIARRPGAGQTYAQVLRLYVLVAGFVVLCVSTAAPAAIHILFPASYHGAAAAVPLLAVSYLLMGLTYIAAIGPSIAGSTRPIAMATFIAAALTVPLLIILVPPFGVVGAAVATAVAYLAQPLWVFWRGQRLWRVPYDFPHLLVGVAVVTASSCAMAAWDHGDPAALTAAKSAMLLCVAAGVAYLARRDIRLVAGSVQELQPTDTAAD